MKIATDKEFHKKLDEFIAKGFKECCAYFWLSNNPQNILNQPIKYCGYCGTKLTPIKFKTVIMFWYGTAKVFLK